MAQLKHPRKFWPKILDSSTSMQRLDGRDRDCWTESYSAMNQKSVKSCFAVGQRKTNGILRKQEFTFSPQGSTKLINSSDLNESSSPQRLCSILVNKSDSLTDYRSQPNSPSLYQTRPNFIQTPSQVFKDTKEKRSESVKSQISDIVVNNFAID